MEYLKIIAEYNMMGKSYLNKLVKEKMKKERIKSKNEKSNKTQITFIAFDEYSCETKQLREENGRI